MTSTFDPAAFENQIIDQGNETVMTPVPEGEYRGFIKSVRVKAVTTQARGDVPVLEVIYQIDDETGELAKEMNRDEVTVRQDVWLDVTENGALAFGPNQNVGLGKLREAVSMNDPSRSFTFKQLEGAGPVLVTVTQNPSKNDASIIYNNVPRVIRA